MLVPRDQMAVFIGRAFTIPWGGRVIGGVNLLKATTDPGYLDPMDDFFHGTMVSGTIASMDTTYRGIAPAANIVGVKVLDNQGNGYSSDVHPRASSGAFRIGPPTGSKSST